MTVADFVARLLGRSDKTEENLLHKAHDIGLTDKYMTEHPEMCVTRRDAAKIIHVFLRDVLSEPDLGDISKAAVLKDLYDCRVCVNDIAQVFCRGIMKGHGFPNGLLLFEGYCELTDEEAEEIFLLLSFYPEYAIL